MNNYEHISEAIKLLKENKILEVKNTIKLLFDDIPCLVCFIRKITGEKKKEWDEFFGLKQAHHKYEGNIPPSNFKNWNGINSHLESHRKYYCHVITSILLISEENYKKADEILTKAIELAEPFDCDIALSLRALNNENDEVLRLNDIQRATILNPCSRNFKQLASFYDSEHLSLRDHYLEQALIKSSSNQCALNALINRISDIKISGSYILLKRLIGRYEALIKEERNFAYILIAACYLKQAQFLSKNQVSGISSFERPQESEELLQLYKKALEAAQKGKKHFPDINLYDAILAKVHLNLEDFELANKYAKAYLNFAPNDKIIKQVTNSSTQWKLIHLSIDYYKKNEYEKVIELLDEASYTHLPNNFAEESRFKIEKHKLSKIYTECLIKINNPKFTLVNDYSEKIKDLRDSYFEKKRDKNHSEITEDEKNASNINLYYSTTQLGFGKYEGKTVGEILKNDPQYIYYCINNLFHFALGLNYLASIKELRNQGYFRALENNFVKNIVSNIYIPNRSKSSKKNYSYSPHPDSPWLDALPPDEASVAYWNTH